MCSCCVVHVLTKHLFSFAHQLCVVSEWQTNSATTMSLARGRSRPIVSVTDQDYKDAVQRWLLQTPMLLFSVRIGPIYCKKQRQVTPGSLMAALKCFESVVKAGLSSCVLQKRKLEYALKAVLSSNEKLLEPSERAHMDVLIYDACIHLGMLASMLRDLLFEESNAGVHRRYPKTGGIRRIMHAHHWISFKLVMEIMKPSEQRPHRESSCDTIDYENPESLFGADDTIENDDFPSCSCDEHFEIVDESKMLPSVSDLLDSCIATSAPTPERVIVAVTPQPKKRKQEALARAANLSSKKSKQRLTSSTDSDAAIQLVKVFMTVNKDASRVDMTATGQLANGETKRVSIFSTRKLPPAGARFLGNKCKEFAEARIASGESLTKDDILQLKHDLIANVV